jgi:23S rRNA G2069 N7-methylase RlmK/C1962 C5-methylase RlmI
MARKAKRGEAGFDLIIVDPPTFGRSAGKAFSTERDLNSLALNGMLALNPGGHLLLTVNTRGIIATEIEDMVRRLAREVGRELIGSTIVHPPVEDFVASPDESRSMRGVFAQLS